ncbi:MAG: hypothetical protein E7F83_15210 [Clostridium sp.]|mgnify:FL=1|jgi:hypothetical protein|uniref:hypothetical protein n=1 Tax=Clostridium TaxID=1485 RepID=UPI000C06FB5F|nr:MULTISPECIES: hypothetical protein [Clostridium]MBP1869943.1 hypothetical protein [Clostridium tertium]MBS5886508.1 hypothetical protein [Clostridium sp.]MBS6503689.1 hypothetical protein [Clostridium sp.]MBU6134866.1 hypothetical protein [Clostridium tertium]MDB1948589.1 hypothetical protein [Clostridium tertium]
MIKNCRRQILLKKAILNFLLGYLSPSNKLIIYLSQDLDKLISKSQKNIYKRYIRKHIGSNPLKKVA